jgi:hypothetical protein
MGSKKLRKQEGCETHRYLIATAEKEQRVGHSGRKCCQDQRDVAVSCNDSERSCKIARTRALKPQRDHYPGTVTGTIEQEASTPRLP